MKHYPGEEIARESRGRHIKGRNAMTYDLGFIGTGNMGSALARAAAKTVDPARILLCNRTREKAGALANALSCASGSI